VLRFNQSDLTDESDELMLAIEAALF
jgi:hypothetical protein